MADQSTPVAAEDASKKKIPAEAQEGWKKNAEGKGNWGKGNANSNNHSHHHNNNANQGNPNQNFRRGQWSTNSGGHASSHHASNSHAGGKKKNDHGPQFSAETVEWPSLANGGSESESSGPTWGSESKSSHAASSGTPKAWGPAQASAPHLGANSSHGTSSDVASKGAGSSAQPSSPTSPLPPNSPGRSDHGSDGSSSHESEASSAGQGHKNHRGHAAYNASKRGGGGYVPRGGANAGGYRGGRRGGGRGNGAAGGEMASYDFYANGGVYPALFSQPFSSGIYTHEESPLSDIVRSQLEYYFSRDNLSRDRFLCSRMDSQGWVDITLILGFRKVHNFDPSLVVQCMLTSPKLEVNEMTFQVRPVNYWAEFAPQANPPAAP